VLVEGASRRGAGQATGRDPYHRVVNLAAEAEFPLRSGDLVRARVVEATPHSLIGEPVGAARPIAVKNQAFRADTGERSAQL